MTNRLELNWKLDGFVDDQRYYCSETPIDVNNLPVQKAIIAGDVRTYSDTAIEVGKTYYVAVSSVKGSIEKVSQVIEISTGGDEHWDKVVALLHFDGDLTDETGRVWHLGGSVLTEDGRFDGGLRRYGGSNSTYTDSLGLYDDTYTIEFWYRQDANKGQYSAIFAVGVDNILFRVHPGGGIELLTNDNTYVGSGISPIIGGWYHICIQRNDEGVLGWYVDGIYRGGVVRNPYNGSVHIGYSPKDPNDAWFTLDELRITKGVARYTANFTPPNAPFPSY